MSYSRRDLLAMASSIGVASLMDRVATVRAQPGAAARSRTIETSALTIGFEESGDPQGFPIVLLHGFPDDARAYDRVAPTLVTAGYRVIVPYLRGYGPTRIRDPRVRTGEQAAIGQDVIDLMDAIGVKRFAVSGYDWGGRAGVHRRCPASRPCACGGVHQRLPDSGHDLRSATSTTGERAGDSGTSTTSTPNAAGSGSRPIVAASVACSGRHGRRPGSSPTRNTTRQRCRSTTRISSTS